ncbi:hypothetical protein Y032_0024g979 [Ancylostoma ceylanicum]|uniref:Uncharacterized protein n=1 Tax=Ancylostoma ceylanicum TaxID=53326 RepID=A0A016UYU3_9BILA|nr:hypothetical protein Y032_0024g979 [Ancylostoma ceylanicum]
MEPFSRKNSLKAIIYVIKVFGYKHVKSIALSLMLFQNYSLPKRLCENPVNPASNANSAKIFRFYDCNCTKCIQ